jgi:hypothetical protein
MLYKKNLRISQLAKVANQSTLTFQEVDVSSDMTNIIKLTVIIQIHNTQI